MIVDTSIPQPQPLPAMGGSPGTMALQGIRSSSDIVDHLDKVLKSQPPEVQAAVDHAHGIMGMTPPSQAIADTPESTAAPLPSNPAPDAGPIPSSGSGVDSALLGPSPQPIQSSPSMAQPLPSSVSANPHMQNLERMTAEGPGVNKIHNPFLRGLAHVGDAIGSGIFPEFTGFVPGFTAHHNQLLNEEEGQLGQEQKAAKSTADVAQTDATTEHEKGLTAGLPAEAAKTAAETQNYISEAEARQNPLLKPLAEPVIDPNDPTKTPRIGYADEHDKTGKVIYGPAVGARPVAGHEPTNDIEFWMKANPTKKIEDFWKEKATATGEEKAKPLTKETADTLNSAWKSLAPKYHLATDPFRDGMSDSEVKHVQDSMNAIVQRNQGAQNITINQEKADTSAKRDPNTEKEYKSIHDDLNKKFATTETQLQNADQAIAEINSGAMGQAFGTIKSLVALAGGQGSGVRITQAELNSIAKARGIKGDLEGWFNSLAGEGKLSGEQVQQLNSVLSDVKRKGEEKRALLSGTLDKLAVAKDTKEIRAIEKEYRDSGAPVDPNVKAYADAHFNGDIAAAKAAIEDQKKAKK